MSAETNKNRDRVWTETDVGPDRVWTETDAGPDRVWTETEYNSSTGHRRGHRDTDPTLRCSVA